MEWLPPYCSGSGTTGSTTNCASECRQRWTVQPAPARHPPPSCCPPPCRHPPPLLPPALGLQALDLCQCRNQNAAGANNDDVFVLQAMAAFNLIVQIFQIYLREDMPGAVLTWSRNAAADNCRAHVLSLNALLDSTQASCPHRLLQCWPQSPP